MKIIITGVTGQDGSLMADYLLSSTDHEIYGAIRRLSVDNHKNIIHLKNHPRFHLVNLDLNDAHSIRDVIMDVNPDFFINLGAQSFVGRSWNYPIQTWVTDADAVLHILESIRRFCPNCRFYNAGSSEEFGDVVCTPQDENHPLRPQSPYGAAKCAARHIVRVYRNSYNLYAIQGWLFNHEGPRRGFDFVTRKITSNIARIKHCIERNIPFEPLELGNLSTKRDWTDASDMMRGIWLMLNAKEPKNYVLASGQLHSVRDFLRETFKCADINFTIKGVEEEEVFLYKNKKPLVIVNKEFYRPAEVQKLCGDYSLAQKDLGWEPKTKFKELVKSMYDNDYDLLKSAV